MDTFLVSIVCPFITYQGYYRMTPKSDNKAGCALAWMFLIVGAWNTWNVQLIIIARQTKFDKVYAKNYPLNRYHARIGQQNSQTRAPTQAVQAPKGSTCCTSVYDWKDVDSFVASHLWTGSEFCSLMKSYSPSNKPSIIRTTGAGAPRLKARLLSSSNAKI